MLTKTKIARPPQESVVSAEERVLGQMIGQALIAVMANEAPKDIRQSEEWMLEQATYLGFELWERWKRLVNEERAVERLAAKKG